MVTAGKTALINRGGTFRTFERQPSGYYVSPPLLFIMKIGDTFSTTEYGYTVSGQGECVIIWEVTMVGDVYLEAKQIRNDKVMQINPDFRQCFLIKKVTYYDH